MTKEEAIQEVNKAFEPAFADYIITALTEGTTVSDKCEDAVSRQTVTYQALDEAIKYAEEVAQENDNVDESKLALLYCDDTECIEDHKARCKKCADEHRQLAEWLKDYKRLKEQEPSEDAIGRAELLKIYENRFIELQKIKHLKGNKGAQDRQLGVNWCINILKEMPPVTPTRKKGKWIEERDDYGELTGWHCSKCYHETGFVTTCAWSYCPNCGAEMEDEK